MPPAVVQGRGYSIAELHCHLWQWSVEEGHARYEVWADESTAAESNSKLETELEERLKEWSPGISRNGVEGQAREVYIEWGAKVIAVLAKELESRRENQYQSLYDAGRLPWQCMNAM